MGWKKLEIDERKAEAFSKTFKKKARFLVDENLGFGTTEVLRDLGWNVKDVSEVGLRGASDEEVYRFAHHEGRILLSHDTDFLDNSRFPISQSAGVVVLPGANGSEEILVTALTDMLTYITPFTELWVGSKIELTAERTMSVTLRNLDTGKVETTRYRVDPKKPVMVWEDK